MVHDQRHGVIGLCLYESVVKDGPHVGARRGRDAVEVLHEGGVEEVELVVHFGEVVCEGLQGHVPEFADEEL